MIRAPDSYVYPAPFNIFEAVFIAPLEQVFLQALILSIRLMTYFLGSSHDSALAPKHMPK